MIERKILATQLKNYLVDEYIRTSIRGSEYSHTDIIKTPLGDKVVIYSSRPGLIIGRKGANIKALTLELKDRFNLNNPQIQIAEVPDALMNARIVAERMVNGFERFGIGRFKGIMHKVMTEVMGAGALGIEICISGKVPSSRSKTWKVLAGYMKKNGDVSVSGVDRASLQANLKSGIVGVQVRIMPKGLVLPDNITIHEEDLQHYEQEEVVEIVNTDERGEAGKKKDADVKALAGEGDAASTHAVDGESDASTGADSSAAADAADDDGKKASKEETSPKALSRTASKAAGED